MQEHNHFKLRQSVLDGQNVLELTEMLDHNDVTFAFHTGLRSLLQAQASTETARDTTANSKNPLITANCYSHANLPCKYSCKVANYTLMA